MRLERRGSCAVEPLAGRDDLDGIVPRPRDGRCDLVLKNPRCFLFYRCTCACACACACTTSAPKAGLATVALYRYAQTTCQTRNMPRIRCAPEDTVSSPLPLQPFSPRPLHLARELRRRHLECLFKFVASPSWRIHPVRLGQPRACCARCICCRIRSAEQGDAAAAPSRRRATRDGGARAIRAWRIDV